MSRITVVGSINIDLVTRVARLPREGETISGTSFTSIPGGKGANQAVCAARLGGEVRIIGRLGNDVFAEQLRVELEKSGVNTAGVLNVPSSSGSAVIMVSDSGANSIVVVPGANAQMSPEALDVHSSELAKASILLTQMETPLATAERLGTIAEELGIPFMLDPAPAQDVSPTLLNKVTWLTPNESETLTLLQMLGVGWSDALSEHELGRAAEHLLQYGPRNVVLKLGERGAFLMGQDMPTTLVPSFPVQAIDTTAAGDAFNGGFAFALTTGGMAPVDAASFACAVAAISVTRRGAQPAMPKYAEVSQMLAREDKAHLLGATEKGRSQ